MSKTMEYEETPVKNNKISRKTIALKALETVGTSSIIWYLIKRHKFALVATWAVIITVFYLAPFVPDLIFNSL